MKLIFLFVFLLFGTAQFGVLSGTCDFSTTSYSTDSTIKTYNLICTYTIVEIFPNPIRKFFFSYSNAAICSTIGGTTPLTFATTSTTGDALTTCTCATYAGPVFNYFGCSSTVDYQNVASKTFSFTLQSLTLPVGTGQLDLQMYYLANTGSDVVLGIFYDNIAYQNSVYLINHATVKKLNSFVRLGKKHPTYCKLTLSLPVCVTFAAVSGLCSEFSSEYDSTCTSTSTATTVSMNYPLLGRGRSAYYLKAPSPLTLTSNMTYSSISSCVGQSITVSIIEPSSSYTVEKIDTLINSEIPTQEIATVTVTKKAFAKNMEIFSCFQFLFIILILI